MAHHLIPFCINACPNLDLDILSMSAEEAGMENGWLDK